MKLAWRTKIGAGSLELSSGRVFKGAMMFSSNMLMGKLAFLRASIVGIDGSFVRSLTTRRGVFSNGFILKISVSSCSGPAMLTTWPASHGKLADSRSRPFVNVAMIAERGGASSGIEKQKHIWVYNLNGSSSPRTSGSSFISSTMAGPCMLGDYMCLDTKRRLTAIGTLLRRTWLSLCLFLPFYGKI